MTKETFVVNGMTCASCVANVENAVNKLDGVDKAVVNLTTEKMSVDYAGDKVSPETIEKAVADAGYAAGHRSSPFLSFIWQWDQWSVYLCQTFYLFTMQP